MNDPVVIQCVDWHERQDELQAIRKSVFIDEQHVPKELEWDGQDANCSQFLASVDSRPVATARLTPQGQIGRMAVLAEYRGQHVGSRLLAAVIDHAKRSGHQQVFLHAQVNVIPFYERYGFVAEGELFMDAGIAHRTMRLVTKPDQNDAEIALETALENRDAVISLAQQAGSSISLFSRDLDPRVFDNAEFEHCIFNLARKHKSTDIRILVQDTSTAIRQGHCLIRLAQKMTSSVFVHNPAKEHSREQSTFMIVDNTGMLYRPQSTSNSYTAVVNHYAPQRAGELSDYFNEMWERSTPDSQIRRLYI